jgi:RNA polymerase sigma factor (sigma-70 family)
MERRSKRKPLTPEQQALAERYTWLAGTIAKSFTRSHRMFREEYFSAARTGLVQAAQSWDSERNVRFSTFASYRIIGECTDVTKAATKDRGVIGEPVYTVPLWSGLQITDHREQPIDAVYEAENFDGRIRCLTPHERLVLRLVFREGLDRYEVAELLGHHNSRLYLLMQPAYDQLRAHYKRAMAC